MGISLRSSILDPAADGLIGLARFGRLMGSTALSLREFRLVYPNLVVQMREVGVASIPIAGLAIAFSGGVTTIQAIYQLEHPFFTPRAVGSFVVPTLVLELGALVTAFILTARVGARITAELATMRVSEQIDALEVMGLNVVSYLLAPRILAGILMFPVIYLIVTALGIVTSALVAHLSGELTVGMFVEGSRLFFRPYDVFFGLSKSVVFGFIITAIPCYKGFFTRGGAESVGRSTTEAAVLSSLFILVADFVAADLLL